MVEGIAPDSVFWFRIRKSRFRSGFFSLKSVIFWGFFEATGRSRHYFWGVHLGRDDANCQEKPILDALRRCRHVFSGVSRILTTRRHDFFEKLCFSWCDDVADIYIWGSRVVTIFWFLDDRRPFRHVFLGISYIDDAKTLFLEAKILLIIIFGDLGSRRREDMILWKRSFTVLTTLWCTMRPYGVLVVFQAQDRRVLGSIPNDCMMLIPKGKEWRPNC